MNATEYRETKFDAALAVVGSVFLHLILFFLLILWLALTGKAIIQASKPEQIDVQEQVLILSPEYFQREVDPPPPPRMYARTNPEVPTSEAENAILIGERSTTGASETVLDEGNPLLPTQITRADQKGELPSTFNSDFVDADINLPPAPKTNSQEALKEIETIARADQTTPNQAELLNSESLTENTPPPPASTPVDIKAIESPNQIETAQKTNPKDTPPSELKTLTEIPPKRLKHENKSAPELPQQQTSQRDATPGFQTKNSKTRIIGSLSRDGKSALNVKGTALGKYYATISKIIEREWQRNCIQYREHIQPGVISMQFEVTPDGRVSNPRPHDVVSTSPIQVGFTMKAVRRSKLPPMPNNARKELAGDSLELIYNFYF